MTIPTHSWLLQRKALKQWLCDRYGWAKLMPLILVSKDNWFAALFTNTIGLLMGRERFRTEFATAIGPVVMIPKEYSFYAAKSVCTHEVRGHVFQFWACGLFLPFIGPWLGVVLMAVLYGLLLPILFNWFRYRLELHADVQKWKWMLETNQSSAEVMDRAEGFAKTVSSWSYGKSIPRAWAVWGFKRRAKKVIDGFQKANS
jgi:hypothetical protein